MADQLTNYALPLSVGLYGTGLGILTTYPQANGNYWIYYGSNGLRPQINSSGFQAPGSSGKCQECRHEIVFNEHYPSAV
jgi:hypothetical protein